MLVTMQKIVSGEYFDEESKCEPEHEIENGAVYLQAELTGRRNQAVILLSKQLEYRFGKLPAWAKQEIAQAGLFQLERWSLRLLKKKSLAKTLK